MKKIIFACLIAAAAAVSVYALNYLNYAERVIVRQRPEANYGLNDNVLRQEVVGIAIRLTGLNFRDVPFIALPDPYTCDNIFTDIKQNTPNTWVCRSVEIASKYGIVSTNNKVFRPEEYITQAEALAMILAAVKLTPAIDKDKPWQGSIMQTAFDLGVISEKSPGTAIMKRGELFADISNLIKTLYKREIYYIETLAK
jgi:S-layer homology domain